MGFNSTLMILNDAYSVIDEDPGGWWNKAKIALSYARQLPKTFGHGNHANCTVAIANDHADWTTIIAVGGNYATILGQVIGYRHHTDEDKLRIMKTLAKAMGYKMVRLSGKK